MPYYMYHAFWTDLDLTPPRLGYLLQAVFRQDQLQEEPQGCDSIDSFFALNIAPIIAPLNFNIYELHPVDYHAFWTDMYLTASSNVLSTPR